MARDAEMHLLLVQWAQMVTVGDGSGYPTMSVLHESWQPPSPGQSPTLKVAAPSAARRTHRVIGGWSMRLRNTVILHYCTNMPVAEQALRLDCDERTVYTRIEQAHGLLRDALSGKLEMNGEPR